MYSEDRSLHCRVARASQLQRVDELVYLFRPPDDLVGNPRITHVSDVVPRPPLRPSLQRRRHALRIVEDKRLAPSGTYVGKRAGLRNAARTAAGVTDATVTKNSPRRSEGCANSSRAPKYTAIRSMSECAGAAPRTWLPVRTTARAPLATASLATERATRSAFASTGIR